MAAGGDAKAQSRLSRMYWEGTWVQKDEQLALQWANRAAAQADSDAQYLLANAYETGRGCSQDYTEAFRWYLAAADNPKPGDMPNNALHGAMALGFMYAHQLGPSEYTKEVLARLGHFDNILVHFCTAIILSKGYGVEKNMAVAARSLLRVVELDVSASRQVEGVVLKCEYVDNHRQPVNLEQVRVWLEDAASLNIADAQLLISQPNMS